MDSTVYHPQIRHLNTILFKSLINLFIKIAKFPRPLQAFLVPGYSSPHHARAGCSEEELLRKVEVERG